VTLASLRDGYAAAVLGATGGLGAAFVAALAADPRCARVHALARQSATPLNPDPRIEPLTFDLLDESSIAGAAAMLAPRGPLDLVLVATGVLHDGSLQPEKSWRTLSAAALQRAFAVNAIGPALAARHLLPLLARDSKSVFAALSARVGSIADNRLGGWHAYRASKAALNMLVRTLAIELAQRNRAAICVALHPGTVDTRLSRPFQAGVPPERLMTPADSAARLLRVIDGLTPERSGTLVAWDGETIPF
jgi:NAD(P)-dependent dehydrogenase (short-subunit alcohol dehydrogenase family)